MKHYTIQTLQSKKYLAMNKADQLIFKNRLRCAMQRRNKRGVVIPGLCETEGCDNIKHSLSGNCKHCLPCKRKLLNEGSLRFQDEYFKKHGISYYDATILKELERVG